MSCFIFGPDKLEVGCFTWLLVFFFSPQHFFGKFLMRAVSHIVGQLSLLRVMRIMCAR